MSKEIQQALDDQKDAWQEPPGQAREDHLQQANEALQEALHENP